MYFLGIDVGGTNISAGIVDENFNILKKTTIKNNFHGKEEEFCEVISNLCNKLVKKFDISLDDISSIGIGFPGSVNTLEGVIEFSANLLFNNFPIKKILEKKLNKKIFIENDANAAVYGEYLAGGAKGHSSAIVITIGTGIGGGIIIDNKIFSGSNYNGAEIGHMVIVNNGRSCSCGRKGCFEAYASASGLVRSYKNVLSKNPHFESILNNKFNRKLPNINAKTIFSAAKKGDKLATSLVDKYLDYLSCGIVNIINIFQPEILLIGGGVSHEGEFLLTYLQKSVEKYRYSKNSSRQSILKIATLGNDAGIIGAAFLEKFLK